MIWHVCLDTNTGGMGQKQMGLSVRPVLPPLVHVSIQSMSPGVNCVLTPLPLFLLPASLFWTLHYLSSLWLYHFLNSVSFSYFPPSISVPTYTTSISLYHVLPDSSLLCTVQSSVYESLTTTKTSCTLCVFPAELTVLLFGRQMLQNFQ